MGNHSEMAFNLKWSVIFTLAMVGQLLKFGSASTTSLTPEMLEKSIERLDENGNNFISKREFFQVVESLNEDMNDPKELSRNTVNVLFNDLDKNNDGELDIEEFKKLGSLVARRGILPIPILPIILWGIVKICSIGLCWG